MRFGTDQVWVLVLPEGVVGAKFLQVGVVDLEQPGLLQVGLGEPPTPPQVLEYSVPDHFLEG